MAERAGAGGSTGVASRAIPVPSVGAARPVFPLHSAFIAHELRSHAAYLAMIGLYALCCPVVALLADAADVVSIGLSPGNLGLIVLMSAALIVLYLALHTAWVDPPAGRLWPALKGVYRGELLDPRASLRFALAIVPLPIFMTAFGSYKRMIPDLNPFAWDATFARWDRALHGGIDPWQLLHPLVGHPAITWLISGCYQLWLFVVLFTLVWQCWTRRDDVLRMQFLLAFVGSWIVLGTVVATALSAAGPCYFGRLAGSLGAGDPYIGLMDSLREVAAVHRIPALEVQEALWTSHASRSAQLGHGISSMPSMHVASSVRMALLGMRVGRAAGIVYSAFALVILVGSVHLGWHYAVDGYISAVVVLVIWPLCGVVSRRVYRLAGIAPANSFY